MLLQRGDDTVDGRMPVGVWTGMDEDDRGLKLTGKLANTERGRDAHNLLKMKPRPPLNYTDNCPLYGFAYLASNDVWDTVEPFVEEVVNELTFSIGRALSMFVAFRHAG